MISPALRFSKSLWSYNPIPFGCVAYLPYWHPNLSGEVFRSVDFFSHIATNAGSIFQSGGRLFDGVDDKITVPDVASITDIFDGDGGTAISWVNVSSDGEGNEGHLWRKAATYVLTREEAAGKVKINFALLFSILTGGWTTTTTQVTIGTPTMVSVTYNADDIANNPIIYINTTALTVGSGITEDFSPNGTRVTDSGTDLTLGNHPGTSRTFDGIKNEDWFYNRILTATEIAYIYSQTRGRQG